MLKGKVGDTWRSHLIPDGKCTHLLLRGETVKLGVGWGTSHSLPLVSVAGWEAVITCKSVSMPDQGKVYCQGLHGQYTGPLTASTCLSDNITTSSSTLATRCVTGMLEHESVLSKYLHFWRPRWGQKRKQVCWISPGSLPRRKTFSVKCSALINFIHYERQPCKMRTCTYWCWDLYEAG